MKKLLFALLFAFSTVATAATWVDKDSGLTLTTPDNNAVACVQEDSAMLFLYQYGIFAEPNGMEGDVNGAKVCVSLAQVGDKVARIAIDYASRTVYLFTAEMEVK